ncbi:GNAT family N-acetyltransferase [Cryobacterium lactosi]|uniref:GNAT family N-acetyltransferase n=1 Tax=Cryobacterium lactosi TaxID=1259202 RepID=A0A4R9BYT3_9MICO|nr:GNAT family N-acetyltransferase [Cryobacterium lactosi]TFD92108.1 GNAT family N-acetyltransferase [Cryobacterium lactosi]
MFTITPAAPTDVTETAEVLAGAFQGGSVISSLIRAGADSHRRTASLFRALMRSGPLQTGRIDLARSENRREILGAAVWERPGKRASIIDQLTELPTFIRALGWDGLARAARLQSLLASYRPVEPHWYLAQIGVRAQSRESGVGTELLRSRLEMIDATHAPVYLESSNERNRELYKRHGFVAIANIESIPLMSPAGMWRPAV